MAAFAGTAAGYVISYFAGIPVGATIIFTLVIISGSIAKRMIDHELINNSEKLDNR